MKKLELLSESSLVEHHFARVFCMRGHEFLSGSKCPREYKIGVLRLKELKDYCFTFTQREETWPFPIHNIQRSIPVTSLHYISLDLPDILDIEISPKCH